MENLRDVALVHHWAANEDTKQRVVDEIYKEMGPKRNGYVKFKEFSAYMETNGCEKFSSHGFFDLLKHPGDEGLSRDGVITLLNIIYSERPFCGGKCRKFVTEMYFTCVKCFDGSGSTFSVCPQCFVGKHYEHEHEHDEFLDPLVILHLKRELDINQKSSTSRGDKDIPQKKNEKKRKKKRDDEDKEEPTASSTITTSTSTSNGMNSLPASPASSSSSSNNKQHSSSSISNSIVPAVNRRSRQEKIQTAIQVGQLAVSFASAVAACTIL